MLLPPIIWQYQKLFETSEPLQVKSNLGPTSFPSLQRIVDCRFIAKTSPIIDVSTNVYISAPKIRENQMPANDKSRKLHA